MGFRKVDGSQTPEQRQKRTRRDRRLIYVGKNVRQSLRFVLTVAGMA